MRGVTQTTGSLVRHSDEGGSGRGTNDRLSSNKNAQAFFNAIQGAKAPERFTTKFLKDLDFSSSNDRLYLGVLKGLGFLDENGVPTERYFAFLDHSQSGRVLADALREAYDELFALNKNAQTMSLDEVKGKLKSLTQGQKSENVINWMANTFKGLGELADWSSPARAPEQTPKEEAQAVPEPPPSPPLRGGPSARTGTPLQHSADPSRIA